MRVRVAVYWESTFLTGMKSEIQFPELKKRKEKKGVRYQFSLLSYFSVSTRKNPD